MTQLAGRVQWRFLETASHSLRRRGHPSETLVIGNFLFS